MRETGGNEPKQGASKEGPPSQGDEATDEAKDATTDATTTLWQLKRLVADFVEERQWQPFHSPKNLSMSLSIEAAELMEHFQWLTIDESKSLANDPVKRVEVGEELADVLCYGLALANAIGLDVSQIVHDKMEKNRAKYPKDRFQGNYE